MQALKVSLIQSDLVWKNSRKNIENFEKIFNTIEDKPNLIILPEMFTTGFAVEPHDIAEKEDGETLQWMQKQAASKQSAIIGSIIVEENSHFFNRLYFVEPSGKYHSYNKRHLFHPSGEDKHFIKGAEKKIIHYLGWKICPLICYDLRFPVWSKNRYDQQAGYDYDILIYVANWPIRRTYPWNALLIARAIENQSYVLGVNRIGTDGAGVSYGGASKAIDYKGKIIAESTLVEQAVISSTLNYDDLQNFRQDFNVAKDWDNFLIIN